ncbi:lectin [Nocardiopsis sp. FIRDI 009]|uniref:lectin n=1 Tax=Nocardiopsis sp. FIRDI 009 TaxID=714197 RepID=UPI000E26C160|nr:lectin [Nocardiopsis sp. FIRDI 009]
MGFPVGKIKIGLKKPDENNVTRPTANGIRNQLSNIGITCPDTVAEKLQGNIDTVIKRIAEKEPPNPWPSYFITEPRQSAPTFADPAHAGLFISGSHELLGSLTAASPATRQFASTIASTNPGTQNFIDELLRQDSEGQDFVDQVRESHSEAVGFLMDVVNDEPSPRALDEHVDRLGSTALIYMAQVAAQGLEPVAVGTWVPDVSKVQPSQELHDIQRRKNWDKIVQRHGDQFSGQEKKWTSRTDSYTTADAFENLFTDLAYNSSASLANGLAKRDTTAALANTIKPLRNIGAEDYAPGPQSLVLFLAGDYDPTKEECKGVGVLTVEYEILIKDYRNKKKHDPDRKATASVRPRAVTYTSGKILERDHKWALES